MSLFFLHFDGFIVVAVAMARVVMETVSLRETLFKLKNGFLSLFMKFQQFHSDNHASQQSF
jgi:hypothetical protein